MLTVLWLISFATALFPYQRGGQNDFDRRDLVATGARITGNWRRRAGKEGGRRGRKEAIAGTLDIGDE